MTSAKPPPRGERAGDINFLAEGIKNFWGKKRALGQMKWFFGLDKAGMWFMLGASTGDSPGDRGAGIGPGSRGSFTMWRLAMANVAKARKYVISGVDGLPAGVRFEFTNGHTHTVMRTDFDETMNAWLWYNGAAQKFGDAFSKSADADEAEALFLAVLEQVKGGIWSARGGAGGSSDLAEAVARVTGKPIEGVREKLAKMDKEALKALGRRRDVTAAIKAIQAERATKAAEAMEEDEDDDGLSAFDDI